MLESHSANGNEGSTHSLQFPFDVFLAPWDNVTLALRRLANRFLEARNGSILGLKSQGTWKYLEMTSLVIM